MVKINQEFINYMRQYFTVIEDEGDYVEVITTDKRVFLDKTSKMSFKQQYLMNIKKKSTGKKSSIQEGKYVEYL